MIEIHPYSCQHFHWQFILTLIGFFISQRFAMKSCFLKYALVWMSVFVSLHCYSFGQDQRIPAPSLPGYSGFHSNLGIQEIVEVGVPLSEKRKVSSPVSKALSNQVKEALNPRVAQPRSPESSPVPFYHQF